MPMDIHSWSGYLIVTGVVLLVFLLIREFWCWYFKINEMKSLLEKIEANTRGKGGVQLAEETEIQKGPVVSEKNSNWFTRPITKPENPA